MLKKISVLVGLLIVCVLIIVLCIYLGQLRQVKILERIPPAQYCIYTYEYDDVLVWRYRGTKIIYEYAYSGFHILSIIDGTEKVAIVTFPNQVEAKEFSYAYLLDLKMEDGFE